MNNSADFVIENGVLIKYTGTDADVTIPDGVTSIGDWAFRGCKSLTSIKIPDSVTSIGEQAFARCQYLTSITIPNSVTHIGDGAFRGCENLTSFIIPDSVINIGDAAFRGCKSLTSITIPDSVTSIGAYAFDSCENLTSFIIPNSVTSIGTGAFSYCQNLTSITIPNSVTSIGNGAFCDCESITRFTVDADNMYYSTDEHGVLFNKDKTVLIHYPIGNDRTSYTIPNSVTNIGSWAFCYCKNLTSITILDSVTSIDKGAFHGCKSFTGFIVDADNMYYSSDEHGVLFNKDKTTLIQYPGDNKSDSYTIPDSVTYIVDCAFNGCENLTIRGVYGSYAQGFADENSIPFAEIEG
ncbi:MAG: leucine-rich repeat domain-containing protein [Clostridia bacterium]|nr:leucine-rich repeat domain-containing protein [Clostridia bacterium]